MEYNLEYTKLAYLIVDITQGFIGKIIILGPKSSLEVFDSYVNFCCYCCCCCIVCIVCKASLSLAKLFSAYFNIITVELNFWGVISNVIRNYFLATS